MKKLLSIVLSLVVVLIVISAPEIVCANSELHLPLNGGWLSSVIEETGGSQYVKINLTGDGALTITYMHYFNSTIDILNEDLSESLFSGAHNNFGGSIDSPETNSYTLDLDKGTYYIRVGGLYYQYYSGKYKIKGICNYFNNYETEADSYDTPNQIGLNGESVGALTIQDRLDWYCFKTTRKTKLEITYLHYYRTTFDILNEDLTDCIFGKNCFSGTPTSPSTEKFTYVFTPGTYYIKIGGLYYQYYSGKYKIQIRTIVNAPKSFKVSKQTTSGITLNWGKNDTANGYQLQIKTGNTWKTIKNTSAFSYTVNSLKSGSRYDFRVRSYLLINGTNYYSSWTTLTTTTKPNSPTIKTPSTNKKHEIIAKWKKVSAGTGYQIQYSKNKLFTSNVLTKTISGITKTSCTGKNFSKNKTYYIRIRSYKTLGEKKYYSAWSKTKSIKCK